MPKKKPNTSGIENDPVLEQIKSQWDHEDALKDKAALLLAFIQYIRRRYRSVAEWREELNIFIEELETVCEGPIPIDTKELIPVSRAISFARRVIPRTVTQFGSALQHAPVGNELAKIRRLKSPQINDLIDPSFEFEMQDLERELADASEESGPASVSEL